MSPYEGAGVSPPRRIVTGHASDGRSTVLSDAPIPSRSLADGNATFYEVWRTADAPARIDAVVPGDVTAGPLRVPPDARGTVIRVVDLPPGARSPMHRTQTVDYGILLAGELHLVLDDGSERVLGVGDIVVQRGTDHAWHNRSGDPVRVLFILVDGEFSDELRALIGPAELYDHELDAT
jgi:quercetin dioxygenase-like cupin family protein